MARALAEAGGGGNASRWDGEDLQAFTGTYGEYNKRNYERSYPQLVKDATEDNNEDDDETDNETDDEAEARWMASKSE